MSMPWNNEGGEISDTAAPSHRDRVTAGLAQGLVSLGSALEKMNISKLMESGEKGNPKLADKLEAIKKETKDETERKQLMEEALAKCKAEMEDHLSSFLFLNPKAEYEDWIQDLHPENAQDGTLLPDFKDVDLRFYIADSDHRLMWNQRVPPDRQVAARTYKTSKDAPVDLLNDVFSDNVSPGDLQHTTNESGAATQASQNQTLDLLGDGWP